MKNVNLFKSEEVIEVCGRITSLLSAELLSVTFGVPEPEVVKPRYNIAPTHLIPVIRENYDNERCLCAVRWGQVSSWANDLSIGTDLINTKRENLTEKQSFCDASTHCRCIIPANGFYVWFTTDDRKQPWYVTRKDGAPMAFAGLLEQWCTPGGNQIETCTIITVAANELFRHLHDRMPAILESQDFPLWLESTPVSSSRLISILKTPSPDVLITYPVSTLVNNPACDGADCIEPA